jgi:membrane fusion protein (multidrug efflux system)
VRAFPLVPVLIALGACNGSPVSATSPDARSTTVAATPVQAVPARRQNLPVTVSGPGRTDAVEKQKVRAPFNGMVESLSVADGDHVKDSQVIGTIVSRNSLAALEGAREMLRSAHTEAQRRDARRALELARQGLVRARLRAPEAGIVASHQADEGSQVNENDEIVEIVATDSLVFIAQIAQSDLIRVRPGQPATISLAALKTSLPGRVHAVLPSGSASDLTAPVRVDFMKGRFPPALNLFGVVRITVSQRKDALVVPAAALLRNDITGVTRMATVSSAGMVHWVDVETGPTVGNQVQVISPEIKTGTQVIVSGQVGLPEATRVRVGKP